MTPKQKQIVPTLWNIQWEDECSQNGNRPNAVRHGAFAKATILPGEDPQEFQKLFFDLVKEWNPVGPVEQDAVLTIAKCLWRKGRVQQFICTKIATRAFDPGSPFFDEFRYLHNFPTIVEKAPEHFDRMLDALSQRNATICETNVRARPFHPKRHGLRPYETKLIRLCCRAWSTL